LNCNGNVPSVNDSVAKRAINDANRSTDDLITDVGILSITDNIADMLRINLLTSSADSGCKSVSNLPVYFMSDCRGFISHRLIARLDFIVTLIWIAEVGGNGSTRKKVSWKTKEYLKTYNEAGFVDISS